MNVIDECALHYRKLLELLDEDSTEISKGLQGEMLESYRVLLECERQELDRMLSQLGGYDKSLSL